MLKELLGDAYKDGMTLAEAEQALTGRKIVDLASGEYVSKAKYGEAVSDRGEKDKMIADLGKQLEELKKAGQTEGAEKIAALQKELADKQAEFEARYAKREREYVISDALKSAKAKNVDALRGALSSKFDFDKAEIKDGKVTGLDDVLAALKESDGYLFEQAQAPTLPRAGREPGGPAFSSEEQKLREIAFKAAGVKEG